MVQLLKTIAESQNTQKRFVVFDRKPLKVSLCSRMVSGQVLKKMQEKAQFILWFIKTKSAASVSSMAEPQCIIPSNGVHPQFLAPG